MFAHLIFCADISRGADGASKRRRGCKWEWVKEGVQQQPQWLDERGGGGWGGLIKTQTQVYFFSLTESSAPDAPRLAAKLLSGPRPVQQDG